MEKEKEINNKENEAMKLLENANEENKRNLLEIEYKSQAYASYYNTSMERDKSLLTLSVAGLGFLVTLINVTGKFQWFEFMFFLVAAASFVICLLYMINVNYYSRSTTIKIPVSWMLLG